MHLKTDKVDLKKKAIVNFFFFQFFQSTQQVDMKNVVVGYKHFFGYFNALETNGDLSSTQFEPAVFCSRLLP